MAQATLDCLKCKQDDLGVFLGDFGERYPSKIVTGLAEDFKKENHSEIEAQERKLDEICSKKVKYQNRLAQIEEDIKNTVCQCVKLPLSQL